MNIYLIKQKKITHNNTCYESFVVVSESEEKAKMYHPGGGLINDEDSISHVETFAECLPNRVLEEYLIAMNPNEEGYYSTSWTLDMDNLSVTLVGVANESFKEGDIINSSYLD